MKTPIRVVTLSLCLGAGLSAQELDLDAAERELYALFERPAGTTISADAKAALADFVERHRDHDLRHLGYAGALDDYLGRRYEDATAKLDRFFERYPKIAHPEHSTMAGRVYLNAVRLEGEKERPDLGQLTKWGERMARLYPDTGTLGRYVSVVLRRVDEPAPVRLALVRGVLESPAPDADKDEFVASVYSASSGAGLRTPKAAPRRSGDGDASPEPKPTEDKVATAGEAAPSFTALHALNGDRSFDPKNYRGKVVVLDFWATWCPPCRSSIPSLLKTRERFGDKVQFLGVTRLYGRGMDFSAPDASVPHGGKAVRNLSRDAEVAINQSFAKKFGIDYPILIAEEQTAGQLFGVTVIPTMFVIDTEGKIAGKVIGGGLKPHGRLDKLIEEALGR